MARDRHGDYFDARPQLRKVIRLDKIALNFVDKEGCSVGTHDLGRRYRVLHEGQYPPFRWSRAWFQVQISPNGKITWGEEVEEPPRAPVSVAEGPGGQRGA